MVASVDTLSASGARAARPGGHGPGAVTGDVGPDDPGASSRGILTLPLPPGESMVPNPLPIAAVLACGMMYSSAAMCRV